MGPSLGCPPWSSPRVRWLDLKGPWDARVYESFPHSVAPGQGAWHFLALCYRPSISVAAVSQKKLW